MPIINKNSSCQNCGQPYIRVNTNGRFCGSCSVTREDRRVQRRKSRIQNSEIQIGESETLSFGKPSPIYHWVLRFKVPFSWSGSKNSANAWGKGNWYKKGDNKKFENAVTALTQSALQRHQIKMVKNKVWIGVFIQMPTHRGDAINFIDSICDGVKKGISVDDRWFCISFLDWKVNRQEPHIFVQIGQDADWDAQVCKACGRIRPLTDYRTIRGYSDRHHRYCFDCVPIIAARNKEKKDGLSIIELSDA